MYDFGSLFNLSVREKINRILYKIKIHVLVKIKKNINIIFIIFFFIFISDILVFSIYFYLLNKLFIS
jgi:hypothetical protein